MEDQKPERLEKWANVAQQRYYLYLRRRVKAGATDVPLQMDTVNKATRSMERLAGKEKPTEDEKKRLALAREALWIKDE